MLDGANKYKCPKQGKAVQAVKRMSVDLPPNVLMVQLKRFEFSLSGHKISKKVRGRDVCVGGYGGGDALRCLREIAPPSTHTFTALHTAHRSTSTWSSTCRPS